MVMPLLSPASGAIRFRLPEGSALAAGDVIATLELDDPRAVVRATEFEGTLPELGPPQVASQRVDHRFAKALEAARMVMAGAWRAPPPPAPRRPAASLPRRFARCSTPPRHPPPAAAGAAAA